MFEKTSKTGEVLSRDFLLLKVSEQNDVSKGLKRLNEMGWDVPLDTTKVKVTGQRVERV